MTDKSSERRMAENELVFRQANEQVTRGLANFKKDAEDDGHNVIAESVNIDSPLHFFCECSDELCRKRIIMRPSQYMKLHKDHKYFVLIPGHEITEVESIVQAEKDFVVVKKHEVPPVAADGLQVTDVDNV